MILSELTAACRKLRLRKAPLKFRPKLVYLVSVRGTYAHPSRDYLTGGQTAWSDTGLWFGCYGDAKAFAETRQSYEKATVIKLNICAFEEPIIT